MEPVVLVHGGAGNVRDQVVPAKLTGVRNAALRAYKILRDGGNALDAVEEAVRVLEDDESMNAGRGSVLNADGEIEMDASIMNGENLESGAVAAVRSIAHPISLARMVMDNTPHVLLAGTGANDFARENGVKTVPTDSLITDDARNAWNHFRKFGGGLQTESAELESVGEVGTVGAVAIDRNGHVAAATSTGGLNGKMPGRVGDTPIIGGGTYADDEFGAVSATGHGESLLKFCFSHAVVRELENGLNAQKATDSILNKMLEKMNHEAGAICISKNGDIGVGMTTKRMSWAYQKGEKLFYGIDKGEQKCDLVKMA